MAQIKITDDETLAKATRALALTRPLGRTLNPARKLKLQRLLKVLDEKRARAGAKKAA